MSLLGISYESKESAVEDVIAPLMDTFTSFRDRIKVAAKDKNIPEIFRACD